MLKARLESSAFDCDAVRVLALEGRERLSEPFRFHITLESTAPEGLDLEAVIGAEATMSLAGADEDLRGYHGMVLTAERLPATEAGNHVYRLELVPRMLRLAFVKNVQIHVKTTVADVLRKKLRLVGLDEGTDFVLRLEGPLVQRDAREMIVQYRETDFAFVSRLLEQYGVCYYFEHTEGFDKLIITDHAGGFGTAAGGQEVPFVTTGEGAGVFDLAYRRRLIPRAFVCRDYSAQTPHIKIQSDRVTLEQGDMGGVFEYGLDFGTVEHGNVLAQNLAEQHLAERDVYTGQTSLPQLCPGHVVSLSEAPPSLPDLTLVEVDHQFQGTGDMADDATYRARFTAIPAGRMYRPALSTPVPRIHGLVHAVVQTDAVGTIGKFAQLDADGRYLVKFRFDASATDDGAAASCRVRMLQPSAGPGYGTHFPLRPGVEVLVGFIDGNPDRPIIVGAAPNAVTPSPVSASNSHKNRISTGSGALIEIDDGA